MIIQSLEQAIDQLKGSWLVNAEFMYRPRPTVTREQAVFDAALRSRLTELKGQAALFICDSSETAESLAVFEPQFPAVKMTAIITNPPLWESKTDDTPKRMNWDGDWHRYQMTDRWARIDAALEIGTQIQGNGYLLMPAHDAVWGRGLLGRLARFSQHYAKNGLPAAVSPYTYYQHSTTTGVPQDVIDLLNTAFGRDVLFGWKLRFDRVQAFWGKMGMIPFGVCATIRERAEKIAWEDDLEIDGVIRGAGYGVRAMWVRNPSIYRQLLPVFDREGVKRVIERTLHYSLNVPDDSIGASSLNFPLGTLGHLRRFINPRFARYNTEAETLIAECCAVIANRLEQFGASWVDWGAYRHVIRVGDPVVEVWKRDKASPNPGIQPRN
ncbi:MAG: hypothetical protein K8L97_05005 [Anaerolineae bacterium]|nr:hypothetical protein [Anaerolineae bacterium]